MPFPYKTVLITGATAGIGRAWTERMVENGVFVVAVGRRRDRLDELAARFGDKIGVEEHDVADLDGLASWAKSMTTKYPTLDCIMANAGVQNTTNLATLTKPGADGTALAKTITGEVNLNYLSPVHTVIHFLPHLSALGARGQPTAVVLVTSGLALVPMSRCGNYCATKAALHSFAWTLRAQLRQQREDEGGDSSSSSSTVLTRVIEVVPPAVKTELHSRQPDLVAAGAGDFGMELDDFTNETWAALSGDEPQDEILVGPTKRHAKLVDATRESFVIMDKMIREQGKVTGKETGWDAGK
ncbi:hypothetical protein MGG_10233 [Pyricularia oryzae 70-15]|uniref:Short-chain dehydrogenase/reductase SDR n=3 Tax=Pyricularia oryzae TaxID=318829 RepID=Q2KEN5_PYRO7|nr:uncharacterized protein MGG_10233 [Pyricularia oryzae 70-15]ELQ32538.1 short-chain dehydrogenase/reductase SDR [Pyricularia oryzae Y34]KAI7910200.1 hypothetical protein M9X92_011241 [Pyricularia oryzae]EAQ71594.1 hypothetical protein MGCH7_ch7g1001 [Pyricularia oryzae 70-15]KAI7911324.1 hypothetical protein M0657_011017 [Pyricularia oryzae]KYQ30547.1 hypothetical protein MGG_10233 [Pyricularia oryzae 70-15]